MLCLVNRTARRSIQFVALLGISASLSYAIEPKVHKYVEEMVPGMIAFAPDRSTTPFSSCGLSPQVFLGHFPDANSMAFEVENAAQTRSWGEFKELAQRRART